MGAFDGTYTAALSSWTPGIVNPSGSGYGFNGSISNTNSNYGFNGSLTNIGNGFSDISDPYGIDKMVQVAQTHAPAAEDSSFLSGLKATDVLAGIGQALNAFSGIGSYLNGRSQIKLAKQALNDQRNQFNESYNNILKQYNTGLADRLRARAAFETGDSTAYNDEIAANSMRRGETGNSNASYLNYQRTANADNPYKKETA